MTLYIDFVRVYRTQCDLRGLNPLGPLVAYERFLSEYVSYSVLWKPHNPRLDFTILLKTVQCIASTSRRTYLVVGSSHWTSPKMGSLELSVGFEPTTCWLLISCSSQLSYRAIWRSENYSPPVEHNFEVYSMCKCAKLKDWQDYCLVPGTRLELISSDYQSLILNQLYYPGINKAGNFVILMGIEPISFSWKENVISSRL